MEASSALHLFGHTFFVPEQRHKSTGYSTCIII